MLGNFPLKTRIVDRVKILVFSKRVMILMHLVSSWLGFKKLKPVQGYAAGATYRPPSRDVIKLVVEATTFELDLVFYIEFFFKKKYSKGGRGGQNEFMVKFW